MKCRAISLRIVRLVESEDFYMAMEAAEIERLILEGIPNAHVTIEDLRGDGDDFDEYVF